MVARTAVHLLNSNNNIALSLKMKLTLLYLLQLWHFKAKSNEKALRETQTLCAGCSKAEPKIFTSPQTPFSGAQDGQNLISWRWSLPSPTDPVW